MSDWSHGYVTGVEYDTVFFGVQAPSHLDLVAILTGIEPPERLGGASYCELGCGTGYTLLLFAAANPDIACWGIDFNPAHIARARAMQARFGIDNATFLEIGFDELTGAGAPDLPPFDYVTLHGVYSWVDAAQRDAIRRFLAAAVKPGGLVYVSYNAMPAWVGAHPLQHLIRELTRRDPNRIDQAVLGAIDVARRVAEAGSPYLDRQWSERVGNLAGQQKTAYLAHEYCNEHWQPFYHHEVAEDLAAAKLSYIGSAALFENFVQLCLSPDQAKLREAAEPRLRETMLDYFLKRSLRLDVFVKGERRMSAARQDALVRQVRLALVVPADKAQRAFDLSVGRVEFAKELYEPVYARLGDGPATVGELLDLPPVSEHGKATGTEFAGILAGSNQAMPLVVTPDAAARRRAGRINRALVEDALTAGAAFTVVVAPALGTGYRLWLPELLGYRRMLAGAAEDDATIAAIGEECVARGVTFRTDDGTVIDPATAPERVHEAVRRLLAHGARLWRTLGLL
ncbi:MAG: class I SAM-dependent methyltransferase [Stellaceae bacterium]